MTRASWGSLQNKNKKPVLLAQETTECDSLFLGKTGIDWPNLGKGQLIAVKSIQFIVHLCTST